VTDLFSGLKDPTPAERQLADMFAGHNSDEAQRRSFDAFARSGLPHRRMEQWKWSDFRQTTETLVETGGNDQTTLNAGDNALHISFDGEGWSYPDELPEGLKIFPKAGGHDFGQADRLPLGALTAAMTGHEPADTILVEVDGEIDIPLMLTATGKSEAAFGRIVFVMRDKSHLDVIEHYRGGAGLCSILTEFGLGDRAKISRTILQTASRDDTVAVTSTAHLGEGARFAQTTLAFGAKLSRLETHLEHRGREAEAVLNAAYLPSEGYHVDFTTHVTHSAESCVTRQVTKGAVSTGGRGIFQGKFLVPRTVGQFTDADMQHQALLLDHGAEVFAKPELEIYADDVACEHGNTSGQLDETALFYMRQRGIPMTEARAMLTEAFIVEALDEAHENVSDQLADLVRNFLNLEKAA
jgi:Fe-S cluster assembly protein SufD